VAAQSGNLTRSARACLEAAYLLPRAGIMPLTRPRLLAVQNQISGPDKAEL
jgi:hypothetical protein